ncbi:MAG: bifunctional glutamate N-acetyltransferase/amino-acid acetyltransferase ArgJ [Dehalococcoidia bacterium]|nr:bifunctional glutamate N-acetyltransferase/amino-acid acetyltransferase ArgJ [Dehalococcoidia bacterium]MDD5493378.1 bifunctional glutamate N-acetyltransferase/amino-acid acetyltransferase ArgJ [Dehalococcoidia bacterium]
MKITEIIQGTVTSPQGFLAGAVEAGIKYDGRLDVGILFSERPCISAAVFTNNRVQAAPVILSMKHVQDGKVRAVAVNSGCANACTGDTGMSNAIETTKLVSDKLGIPREQVLVASTGVIGTHMPMGKMKHGIEKLKLSPDGGHALAAAIMTTDTRPKEIALLVEDSTGKYTIGGIAKGAGMIHPDMATLLCFLTTDALVERDFLRKALKKAADASFNMITVDGDTSTNDMLSIMANGAAANEELNSTNGRVFQEALNRVCQYLACSIAADGEGATKAIQVDIEGARNVAEARKIARNIAGSSLVKAAIHGNDPNWGRIVAALGRSGAHMLEDNLEVYLQNIAVMKNGLPLAMDKNMLSKRLNTDKVLIKVCLNIGRGKATSWGCDLSEEYVTINSDYTS